MFSAVSARPGMAEQGVDGRDEPGQDGRRMWNRGTLPIPPLRHGRTGCGHPRGEAPLVGVIVGLAGEARVLRACPGVRVACSGATAERARQLAVALVDGGCDAIVSFGLAGGLDPALAGGALCLPEAVLTPEGRRLGVDARWRTHLVEALGGAEVPACLLAGRDAPVATPEEKAELFARHGAVAIDMESHVVAEVAHGRRVPLLVIRAIADAAGRRLPSWLGGVIGEGGRPRLGVLFAGLAAHPGDVADLVRLAGDARKGTATLRRVAAGAGPLLAFPL